LTTVAIIDYGLGNLGSVRRAFADIGASVTVVDKPDALGNATHLVLPGVGAFADGMALLKAGGWVDAISNQVHDHHKPLLGICLGMQLLATEGMEGGRTPGLDLIPGTVSRLDQMGCKSRVPHVGWNDIVIKRPDACLMRNLGNGTDFYFVHSFAYQPEQAEHVVATCNYDIDVVAVIQNGCVMGTQFHPEKSSKAGFQLLRNFLNA